MLHDTNRSISTIQRTSGLGTSVQSCFQRRKAFSVKFRLVKVKCYLVITQVITVQLSEDSVLTARKLEVETQKS